MILIDRWPTNGKVRVFAECGTGIFDLSGRLQEYHDNGTLWEMCTYIGGKQGHCLIYDRYGNLEEELYYVDGKIVHDLAENPLNDEEKILLLLKYGAPLFSDAEITQAKRKVKEEKW